MKIGTILELIDLGSMALPEFQRGYVWNRDQVRGLMHSLYRQYPVGSLLAWQTKTENAATRGDAKLMPGTVKLLLDGQQRITSLYGIIRGRPPKFFDGNVKAFTGLYFHLDDEVFQFYKPSEMKGNPLWINVTELMQEGVGAAIERMSTDPVLSQNFAVYIQRLNAIQQIKEIDLHIEEVVGEEMTVDVVVDIFNRVNSGGTKLSKGDLALAKICAEWPAARDEMKQRLEKWRHAGFHFSLDWLLRVINAIITGEAKFTAIKDVTPLELREGLVEAEKRIDKLLNLVSGRLGLDHDRVLGSRYSFPVMARYLTQRGGTIPSAQEQDRLLYWYVHTYLWGRYSASTESVLNQDLEAIEDVSAQTVAGGIDNLIGRLRQNRGELTLQPDDFTGSSIGNRFYPLLYMMTRVCHARDWGTGDELANHLLGHLSSLQVHHIFPKALLYEHGYSRRQVNAIANFTFLTQETNLQVSRRDPSEYIPAYEEQHPGSVATHWIPMDQDLWRVENYLDFLTERRRLLTAAGNEFLDKLLSGGMPARVLLEPKAADSPVVVPGDIESDEERTLLEECNEWVLSQGLPEGQMLFELADQATGAAMANLDLAWPAGLQVGLSQPVALLIDESAEIEEIVNRAGYLFFTNVDAFREYVNRDVLALESV